MANSRLEGDVHVAGAISCQTMQIPAGTVENTDVAAAAGIAATKLQHQHSIHYVQDDGSDVVAATVPIYMCRGATATVVDVKVSVIDAPSGGGTEAIEVDIQKCNKGTPTPATIMDSEITYTASQTDCEVVDGTISSASLVAEDQLLAIVAVSGTGGAQGQGLLVHLTIREDAE